jgi:hypothetical protein
MKSLQREFSSQHDFGFIYLPSFAHSYSVTNSTEDKRQALAAAEVCRHVPPWPAASQPASQPASQLRLQQPDDCASAA